MYEQFFMCSPARSREYTKDCKRLPTRWRSGLSVCFAVSRSGLHSLCEFILKDFKNVIRSSPAWRSAFRKSCGQQAGKFACCVLGQGTKWDTPTFMWKTGGPQTSGIATPKRVRTFRPKYSNTIRFLVNGG